MLDDRSSMKVGWVGLGSIGTQMAKRVLAKGHRLTLYARGAGLAELRAAGARETTDYQELAAASDILALCLFSDDQLRDVLLGQGALAAMPEGSIVAIHTTGSPSLARQLSASAPAGVDILDATFSGGPAETAEGALTLMVGGPEQALERALPTLRSYASRIHHVGPTGAGQTIKLLNNLLFATNLMNAVEALRLAEAQGFDTATVARIVQDSSGASFAMGRFSASRPLDSMLEAVRHYLAKDVAAAAAGAADAGLDLAAFAPTLAYFPPASPAPQTDPMGEAREPL